ncbi:MAG: system mannose/fructose-specific component [Symbiobacteriaceae bacterium]|nr:system mannose/fructose-specific component [Symbiobacteriaceae bacterium]
MIGLVLVSHGPLADGLRQAAEMIMGPQAALAVLGLEPAQDMDRFCDELKRLVQAVDQGQGVLVLADLFGGSPANTAAYVLGPTVEVVCGASLPMVLEVLSFRADSDLPALVATAMQAGAAAPLRLADMISN